MAKKKAKKKAAVGKGPPTDQKWMKGLKGRAIDTGLDEVVAGDLRWGNVTDKDGTKRTTWYIHITMGGKLPVTHEEAHKAVFMVNNPGVDIRTCDERSIYDGCDGMTSDDNLYRITTLGKDGWHFESSSASVDSFSVHDIEEVMMCYDRYQTSREGTLDGMVVEVDAVHSRDHLPSTVHDSVGTNTDEVRLIYPAVDEDGAKQLFRHALSRFVTEYGLHTGSIDVVDEVHSTGVGGYGALHRDSTCVGHAAGAIGVHGEGGFTIVFEGSHGYMRGKLVLEDVGNHFDYLCENFSIRVVRYSGGKGAIWDARNWHMAFGKKNEDLVVKLMVVVPYGDASLRYFNYRTDYDQTPSGTIDARTSISTRPRRRSTGAATLTSYKGDDDQFTSVFRNVIMEKYQTETSNAEGPSESMDVDAESNTGIIEEEMSTDEALPSRLDFGRPRLISLLTLSVYQL